VEPLNPTPVVSRTTDQTERRQTVGESRERTTARRSEAQAAAPRPSDIAFRINEQRLLRLEDISELRDAASGVGVTATAVQLADDANSETADRLAQLRALASAAAEDNLGADARRALGERAKLLRNDIDRIAADTRFNGRTLVDGHGRDQDGRDSGFNSLRADSLRVDGIDLSSAEGARAALERIDVAQGTVDDNRRNLIDTRVALDEVVTQISRGSGADGAGDVGDADIEALRRRADSLAQQLRSQPGVAALATGNAAPVGVLSVLIGG